MEVEIVIHAPRPTPDGSRVGRTKVQCSKRHETHLDPDCHALDNQQDNWTERKFIAATPQRRSPPSAAQLYAQLLGCELQAQGMILHLRAIRAQLEFTNIRTIRS